MDLVRADLHNHLKTGGSLPRTIDVNQVIDKARVRLGRQGVLGVINYFPSKRYEDFVQDGTYMRRDIGNALYFPDKQIIVVKGEEVEARLPGGCGQVDLLFFGVDKNKHPQHGRILSDAIKEARDLGALVGADHSFHHSGIGPYLENNPDLLGALDFFGVHNGEAAIWLPGYSKANKKAQQFFNMVRKYHKELRHTLGKLVSSDGHSKFEIGSSYMEIKKLDLTDRNTIVSSLKEGLIYAANNDLPDKRYNSYFGAAKHIAEWAVRKMGVKLGSY